MNGSDSSIPERSLELKEKSRRYGRIKVSGAKPKPEVQTPSSQGPTEHASKGPSRREGHRTWVSRSDTLTGGRDQRVGR